MKGKLDSFAKAGTILFFEVRPISPLSREMDPFNAD